MRSDDFHTPQTSIQLNGTCLFFSISLAGGENAAVVTPAELHPTWVKISSDLQFSTANLCRPGKGVRRCERTPPTGGFHLAS